MKRILTPAALLLCMTLLSACSGGTEDSAVTGTVSDTAVTTELTTEQTTSSALTELTTDAAGADVTSDSTAAVTDSTAAASADSTAAASGSTASSASSAATTTTTTAKQQTSAKHLFDELRPGADCTAYLAANTSYSMVKAPSCIGSGEDRVYTFPEFKLFTYFENGKETVQELELTGKNLATREGIRIGMTTADIEKAYGAPAIPGEYLYSTPDGPIDFLLNSDQKTIKSISLYMEEDPA
ncbi:MAG: hypothetical protein II723_06630 [Oscillospiraceae bacterium]|nr:hypothetical protein [Oscillospiraceae bacterium]